MTRTAAVGISVLVVVLGATGCDRRQVPTAPSPASSGPSAPIPGNLVMNGTVYDTAYRPLPGARVQILDGPMAGSAATADARGAFVFAGALDATTSFRASSDGHLPAIRTLEPYCEPCTPHWWIRFRLDESTPPVRVAGTYALTFLADAACSRLPAELQTRTFEAAIPQPSADADGTTFPVEGATFFEDWNRIGVGVAGDYVAFGLETLVEQLSPNTFLAFGGEAAARIGQPSLSTFAFPFTGTIEYCVTTTALGRYQDCFRGSASTRIACPGTHQLIVARR